jgi:hypothetical protein
MAARTKSSSSSHSTQLETKIGKTVKKLIAVNQATTFSSLFPFQNLLSRQAAAKNFQCNEPVPEQKYFVEEAATTKLFRRLKKH